VPDLTAGQTPELRRELVQYTRTRHAADTYALMIRIGRQPIRPPGHPDQVGRLLATTEADRLERADLWHVDADLADLVDAAYPSMPAFAARAHDLPSRHGFVTFGRPLTSMVRPAIPADQTAAELLADGTTWKPGDAGGMRQVLTAVTAGPDGVVPMHAEWGPAKEAGDDPLTGEYPYPSEVDGA
jgi:hypothetical protein